jgi:glucose/mannose-6-phosphate isomerase
MIKLIENFPSNLSEGFDIAHSLVKINLSGITNVVISGLGGSGIGGSILSNLVLSHCKYPVTINKSYKIPGFVNSGTLFIACSYSGNTEETMSAVNQAFDKNARVIGVTSGGELQAFCESNSFPYTIVPGGLPPRAAFGYAFSQLLGIVAQFEGSPNYLEQLKGAVSLLNQEQTNIKNEAIKIAEVLHETTPIIYCEDSLEGVAVRFRQQINENAKMLCWHHVLPEMNHNEIVGWVNESHNHSVVFLKTSDELKSNLPRFDYVEEIVNKYTTSVLTINAKGVNPLEKWLYLIHLTDFVSVYLSDLSGVDPVEVDVIENLKKRLKAI